MNIESIPEVDTLRAIIPTWVRFVLWWHPSIIEYDEEACKAREFKIWKGKKYLYCTFSWGEGKLIEEWPPSLIISNYASESERT